MIYLIVGHRGVGKTIWLKKLKKTLNSSTKLQNCFFDLDEEIEKTTKKKISELFLKGEKVFRLAEKRVLDKLICQYKKKDNIVFIAVGAGFHWSEHIPYHIIHLIRETDYLGRIFLDRPRLKKNKNPYEEYMFLYSEREKNYKRIKTESFILPEQDFTFNKPEKLIFNKKNIKLNAVITLNKNSLPANIKQWPFFIKKRCLWGFRFFELRDDELRDDELRVLLKIIPKKNQLLSFRRLNNLFFLKKDLSSLSWDWALEKGLPAYPPPVLSLHERKQESFSQVCKKLLKYKAHHFKLAVLVKNFAELMQGHLWFLEDPKLRSFLPVSKDGKWRWYRQLFGPQMKWHFIKESLAGVPDQPFLYEHLISLDQKKRRPMLFATVLGDPVIHSASPAFHRKFFAKQGMVFTKITMKEKEFTKKNLCILQKMGLVFAAVTSPLKKKAFQICDETDCVAQSVRSVNTMIFKDQKWLGYNTDEYGLNYFIRKLGLNQKKYIAVWGGGGIRPVLEKQFPFADFYSARTGKKYNMPSIKKIQIKNKGGNIKRNLFPDIVIWAVGRARMPYCQFPPLFWKPKQVVDLNYTEDSPGLEYALLTGAKYVSGKIMFEYQAKKQQEYFSNIRK